MTVDLRLGDCLAADALPALPDASVDVVLTDPPFDERAHRAAIEPGDWRRGDRRVTGELDFPPLRVEQLEHVAAELARIARRWIVLFAGEMQIGRWVTALEAAGARFVRLGYAARDNPRPQMSGDRPAPGGDPIVIAHRIGVPLRWNGRGRSGMWRAGTVRFDPGGQVHPTQKPLALMRALVEAFSDPAELVLDPFAGAGTTAVACRLSGRRFIGWEVDPRYHAAALRRIDVTREQLGLALTG